jgi:plasmid stabilization system protein ParE
LGNRQLHCEGRSGSGYSLGETLINKAASLADVPAMGPLLPGKATTRFLPVGSYLIIYRPDERRRIVRILRFWHSGRRQRPTR